MPRIPEIPRNGRARITTQAVAPRAAPGRFGSVGGSLEEMGEALLHIEDSVRKVAVLHQTTKATVAANRSIMETQDAALADHDLDVNLPKYQAKLREVANTAIQGVADPLARMEVQQALSTRLTSVDLSLATEARQLLGRKSLEVLDASLDIDLKEQFYRAGTETEKQQILVRAGQLISDHVAAGVLDPIKARERIRKLNDEFREFNLTRHIEMDAESALVVLQSGQHGIKSAEVVQRLKESAVKAVAAQVKRGEVLLSDLQDTNELDALKLLMDDKLTPSVLANLEGRQDVTPQFRDALEDNLLSAQRFVKVSDPAVYLDFLKEAYSSTRYAEAQRGGITRAERRALRKPKSEIRTLMRNLIAANTAGHLAVPDMRQLVGVIDTEFQQAAGAARHNLFLRVVNNVSHAYDRMFGGRDEDAVRTSLGIIQQVESGALKPEQVDEAIRGALRQELRAQHPGMAMREELPDAVVNGRGFQPTMTDRSEAKVQYIFKDGKLVKVSEERPAEQ